MNITTIHWHIEVSSICSLKCPRCPRAEKPETLLNRQLDLKFFRERFGKENVRKAKKISFCGNDGDPIYCKEFINICQWIKQSNPKIHLNIVTNGSYKNSDFWFKIASILNEHDEIHWSLDGWDQKSNEKYRYNCKWNSIMDGITVFKEYNDTTYTVVDTIAFRFNENNFDNIKKIARKFEMDAWQLTKSTKFEASFDDELRPINSKLVAEEGRYEREIEFLTRRKPPGAELKEVFFDRAKKLLNTNEHPALCRVGTKGLFLRANGELYPCCWTANRYDHNKDIIALAETQFNLYQRTLNEILADDWWNGGFEFNNLECQSKCTRAKLTDKAHVTEW